MDAPIELVIENCEPRLSQWLELEYAHAIHLWSEGRLGRVTFTGVRDERMVSRLGRLASVRPEDAGVHLKGRNAIVLDPTAGQELSTEDFDTHDAVVVGGILGTETFDGRTGRLVTSKLNATLRHLGPIQLPIDIAVFTAKYIRLGGGLSDLEFTTELEIDHDGITSTFLPYGYPIADGQVIITPGLVDYLRSGGTRRAD
jgi:ribosome biogenesis SPOUT family RNA methylase Rps3